MNGNLLVEQGIIAGCAGGGFENLCAAAEILDGQSIGSDRFTLSVYPASMPIYMELVRNGCAAKILETGAVKLGTFRGGETMGYVDSIIAVYNRLCRICP